MMIMILMTIMVTHMAQIKEKFQRNFKQSPYAFIVVSFG